MVSVQDLIEQAKIGERLKEKDISGRKALSKAVRKDIREERLEKLERFKSYITKPYSTPVSKATRKKDVEVSRFARKVISKVAPRGSIVRALTQTTTKKSGRGRGRPRATYKTRYVPGIGAVKVPTHIYKKMMAKAKADRRLARVQQELAFKAQMEQRQVQAEQIAMQQDPRFQQQDQFLTEPDQVHEMNVAMAQQQAQQQAQAQQTQIEYEPSRPGVTRRFMDGVSRFGKGISRLSGVRQPQFDQFGRQVAIPQSPGVSIFGSVVREPGVGRIVREPGVGGIVREPGVGRIVREPKITLFESNSHISKGSNLLNARNEFNNPSASKLIGVKRRR